MAKYTASYEFPQDPDRIYGILCEVERMSEFMPFCKRSQVLSRRLTGDGEMVRSNFLLRYKQIGFELDVDVMLTLWPGERRIKVELMDTRFGSGSAQYIVTGRGRTGSRVLFQSDYKVKGLIMRLVFGKRLLFQGLDRVMDRVRQRAETMAEY